jgi:putative hemolysin
MASAVFRLGDRRVGDLMTPRPNVIWLDIDDQTDEDWRAIAESPHGRFPVARDDLDNVIGVVAVKDLWSQTTLGRLPDLAGVLRAPLVVPESITARAALDRFKGAGAHMAIVVDEFGGVSGVVTLTDLLEAIVGDIPVAGEPPDAPFVQREDGSWLVDGLVSTEELKKQLALAPLPDEDEYQTLAGFILMQLGRVPAPGDAFTWDGRRFEVVDMDGNRIDKVLVATMNAE